ncbi:MAG: hypothetical protein ACO3ZY_02015 [Phycisphaerales bacterium]
MAIARRGEQFRGGCKSEASQEGETAAFLAEPAKQQLLGRRERALARRELAFEPLRRDLVRLDRLGGVRLGERKPAVDEGPLPR